MRYLLDTNACIAAMRGHPKVTSRLASLTPFDSAVSTITAYELYSGVEKCSNPVAERAKVELFLKTLQLLPFDVAAGLQAARLRAFLESQGLPIGPYDTLLAGEALATGLTLVTANTAEFSRVPGLVLENWQA